MDRRQSRGGSRMPSWRRTNYGRAPAPLPRRSPRVRESRFGKRRLRNADALAARIAENEIFAAPVQWPKRARHSRRSARNDRRVSRVR